MYKTRAGGGSFILLFSPFFSIPTILLFLGFILPFVPPSSAPWLPEFNVDAMNSFVRWVALGGGGGGKGLLCVRLWCISMITKLRFQLTGTDRGDYFLLPTTTTPAITRPINALQIVGAWLPRIDFDGV